MLLVWRVVQAHSDEDEEDEERPDNFHQELELQHTHMKEKMHSMTAGIPLSSTSQEDLILD